MPGGYALSPELAEQLVNMLAWWNSLPKGPNPARLAPPNRGTANVQHLKITDSVPATEASINYYEADVLQWSADAGAWSVVADASPVRVFHPAGSALAEDDEVDARLVDFATIGGEFSAVFEVISGGGESGTCDLPESATQLAELSNAEDTPENNLEHWTTAEVLQITLSAECCYNQIVRKECKDDGTGVISQRFAIHYSNPVKVSKGPVVEGNTSPESWMDAREDACSDMTDI